MQYLGEKEFQVEYEMTVSRLIKPTHYQIHLHKHVVSLKETKVLRDILQYQSLVRDIVNNTFYIIMKRFKIN